MRDQAAIWKSNHDQVVATKKVTESRLHAALAGLQKIYDETKHAEPSEELVLRINEIAAEAFEAATNRGHR